MSFVFCLLSFVYNSQRLVEGVVGVVVVKSEPRLLHVFRQAAEAFVDRRPVTKMFESGRFALFEGLIQEEPAFVVDVVVEVDICTDHLIA